MAPAASIYRVAPRDAAAPEDEGLPMLLPTTTKQTPIVTELQPALPVADRVVAALEAGAGLASGLRAAIPIWHC